MRSEFFVEPGGGLRQERGHQLRDRNGSDVGQEFRSE